MVPPIRRNSDRKKPRLLLVDDHRGMLDRAVEMLSGEFEIAATATDGRTAIDTARDVNPDAIVLDINMPGLDGFGTFDALQQAGSRTPVVFLSMLDGREEVGAAFRRGGRGYVVKSQMGRDLASALDHVLGGRRFAPSFITLAEQAPGGGHVVHFNVDDGDWVDELAELLEYAIARGDATCVISTADVRERLATRLGHHPRYRAVDALDAVNSFLRRGMPDEGILASIAAELDQYRMASAGPSARLTVFGNMAGLLAADGNIAGALAIERTWDRLTSGLPFLTICGYGNACFNHAGADLWQGVCSTHSGASHASHF
jgi:CheY-like chemotaxis protein